MRARLFGARTARTEWGLIEVGAKASRLGAALSRRGHELQARGTNHFAQEIVERPTAGGTPAVQQASLRRGSGECAAFKLHCFALSL